MYQLKNVRHNFDVNVGDVGVTVRKGVKWSKTKHGDKLELWVCNQSHYGMCNESLGCHKVGEGMVLGYWVGPYGKLPPALLSIEHNITLRDKQQLTAILKKVYGSIKNDDIVTALIYLRTK